MDKKYRVHLLLCAGTSCVASGSLDVRDALIDEIKKQGLEDEVYVATTGCNGFCAVGPLMVAYPDGVFYQKLTVDDVPFFVEEYLLKGRIVKKHLFETPETEALIPKIKDINFFSHQVLVALRNRGLIDPDEIDDYIARDGYLGAGKALTEMTPEQIIEEVKKSGLRGRGGGGFPTGLKWQFCHAAQGSPKYILCNGDEGDPGAFMDRSILESDPHVVLEGMIIGAKAIGAHKGYIYVRAEYPLAIKRLQRAIDQAREYGLLGKDILGSGYDMDIELYFGAGAFVCGEETALMRSIEGQRGMPRPRPPFPANKGLWGKPSVLNNVETYANIPQIIYRGGDWFASLGTEKSKGTKVFALTGRVNNIGLIEVPMGTPLRSIVYDIGGGIPESRRLKAVQIGGPSGGCLPESLIDTPVDYESVIKTGAIVGSGGMVVMDATSCMVDIAKFFLEFTADESCGKCTPCREGTQQLLRILDEITQGRGKPEHIQQLRDLSEMISNASLCGLGQTAPNPVLTTLRYFMNEYEAHIHEHHCLTGTCKRLSPPPCQAACPMGQDAATYIALIAQQQHEKALEIIHRENPFPMSLGRVCPHPCEYNCRRGEVDKPIRICWLKRFPADRFRDRLQQVQPAKVRFPEDRVAIVGGGPAGLSVARDLAEEGYPVTIFEELDQLGGMMWVGIPAYRLPRDVLAEEIAAIERLGVEIRTGVRVGRDVTFDQLKREGYRAFFLGVGAHKGLKLRIPGEEEYEGFVDAVAFLRRVALGDRSLPGKKVCVIGGGNSAIDAARTCLRLGAEEVHIVYRRLREQMPASPHEIEATLDEGVQIDYLTAPAQILGKDGKLVGMQCIKNELGEPDSSGRRRPVPIEGSEFVIECDCIIPAISQEPDLGFLNGDVDFEISRWNSFVVHERTLETNVPGFFAGGDAVSGPSTVVEAIASGHRAAVSIDCYLRGKPYTGYWWPKPHLVVDRMEVTEEDEKLKQPDMPQLPAGERARSFEEVELGLAEETACNEARRCLRCDL
ncbi:MAG: NADH-quinone oxidoreductase subunit NuoF [Candidatus Eisenbacteria bacterium]|nr:NADH-quinone oxidoreductase subunit NuoF [Candidatus Eisenbacteria bacterium]